MSATDHRVLRRAIPAGGFGRNLTRAECIALRRLGIQCSERWIVVQRNGLAHFGLLYYPTRHDSRGFDNASVRVTLA